MPRPATVLSMRGFPRDYPTGTSSKYNSPSSSGCRSQRNVIFPCRSGRQVNRQRLARIEVEPFDARSEGLDALSFTLNGAAHEEGRDESMPGLHNINCKFYMR